MTREQKIDHSLSPYSIAPKSEWDVAKACLEERRLTLSGSCPSGFKLKPVGNPGLKHSFLYLSSSDSQEKLLAVSRHYYLGKGGYGKVKVVEDEAGRRYALKILKANSTPNELEVLKELGYLHFMGKVKGRNLEKHYILMEMVEGIDLQEYLTIYGKELTEAQKCSLAYEMILAIKKLHAKNIVHGDLKPSNFILKLDANGMPTLTCVDFGCSRKITDAVPFYTTRNLIGTALYATPENKTPGATQKISKRTDMYALGKILEHNLHLPSDYGLCNMNQEAVVTDMENLFQGSKNTPLPREKLRERLGFKFLENLRTDLNTIYGQSVLVFILQGKLLVRDAETQKLIFVSANGICIAGNRRVHLGVNIPAPIVNETPCTYANGKQGTLIPHEKYIPFLVKQNENLSLFELSKLAKVNLKDTKIKTLESLKSLVRHTNNVDELLSFFTQLKIEESKHPFLSKERGFFRSNAGMTDSWKEAILIFKVRAMELVKNEMNLQKTVHSPDKYRALFNERRARIFKCNTPTHSREFEKVISCSPK